MNVRKCTTKKPMFVLQTYEDRLANSDLSQKLSERLTNLQKENNTPLNRQNSSSVGPPPPPPPLPQEESPKPQNGTQPPAAPKPIARVQKSQAPPVPEKRSTLSFHQPPPCPTPDYDTLSISSNVSIAKTNGFHKNQDQVEMESLESFELYSPFGNKPRPPDIYFSNTATPRNGSISSGTSTLKKRPVSVTIGEYGNGTIRRQPGKLDFLQNGGDEVDGRRTNQPITSQLASELAQTLNRSNLRRRTESMENLLNYPDIKPQSNGSVRISLSNMSRSKNLAKSTNDLSNTRETLANMFANRVTINVNNNNNNNDKKNENNKNGILKNSTIHQTHRPLVAQKSITFGELPIVINDQPLHVTT